VPTAVAAARDLRRPALSFLLVLAPYWVLPWLLISGVPGPDHPQPTPALMAACIVIFTVGLTLMLGADAQKHAALAARPGLITTASTRECATRTTWAKC